MINKSDIIRDKGIRDKIKRSRLSEKFKSELIDDSLFYEYWRIFLQRPFQHSASRISLSTWKVLLGRVGAYDEKQKDQVKNLY